MKDVIDRIIEIIDEDYELDKHDPNTYLIHKPDGTSYLVDLEDKICTCDGFLFRINTPGYRCKHIELVDGLVNDYDNLTRRINERLI